MINYGSFEFACPKFCGGLWFSSMMEQAGFPSPTPRELHQKFIGEQKSLRVSLVRHPVRWLLMCYNCAKLSYADIDLEPFSWLPCQTFEAFTRAYLFECPDAVSKVFSEYHADSIIRVDDLPWALVELLLCCEVDKTKALSVTRIPGGECGHWTLDKKLYDKVMVANSDMVERYCYV
jgi:hypothetical protein